MKPWEKEPGIWNSFCEEMKMEFDHEKAKKLYLNSKVVRERYRWFSAGFYYGGQS